MSYKYLVREIKLNKLTNIPLNGDALLFSEFWNDLWDNMKIRINDADGRIECWKDGYEYYYLHHSNEKTIFWCDYDKVWSFFQKELKLSYPEIQKFIHMVISDKLGRVVSSPLKIENIYSYAAGDKCIVR